MKLEPSLQTFAGRVSIPVNIMLIGAGLHSDRTYLRHVPELARAGVNARIRLAVDLAEAREAVEARMKVHGANRPDELAFISPDTPHAVDARTEVILNRLVRKHKINAVIVATPPEAHLTYSLWALRNGLSVLVDKPITSRPDAVSSMVGARGIFEDFDELNAAYDAAKRWSRVCVQVNAQRAFHPAFVRAMHMVQDVRDRIGRPVSNIMACHADGQFRLNNSELLDIPYHGFRIGNGKLSHSGYHLIDMVARLMRAGTCAESRPTHLLVHSSFVQPDSLIKSMPRERWLELFGEAYRATEQFSDAELIEIGRRMGEVEAHISIEAVCDETPVTTAAIHLQHNTVSARSWLKPGANLYKQNGRLKRELWHIDSGFAQGLRIETLQAEDKHDRPGAKGDQIGDPNHLELVSIRNEKLVGAGERLEVVNASDLAQYDSQHLHSERAKMAALSEFVGFVQGLVDHDGLTSDLPMHRTGVQIMSAAYQSHILRGHDRAGNGMVKIELE